MLRAKQWEACLLLTVKLTPGKLGEDVKQDRGQLIFSCPFLL